MSVAEEVKVSITVDEIEVPPVIMLPEPGGPTFDNLRGCLEAKFGNIVSMEVIRADRFNISPGTLLLPGVKYTCTISCTQGAGGFGGTTIFLNFFGVYFLLLNRSFV